MSVLRQKLGTRMLNNADSEFYNSYCNNFPEGLPVRNEGNVSKFDVRLSVVCLLQTLFGTVSNDTS